MIRSAMFKLGGLKEKLGSKSGVTLVELLVVMLIVVILAISLVPFLRDYIVRARYTAEAVPVVGDMRTKIELHRYEPGRLPGLKDNKSYILGDPDWGYYQTWIGDSTDGPLRRYEAAVAKYDGTNYTVMALSTNESSHFANDIQLTTSHLTGRRLRPNHVFYMGREEADTPSYAYAIGVFGDNRGLNAGSGYAVLDVYNSHLDMKLVAEWRQFVERGGSGTRIPFVCNDSDNRTGSSASGRAAFADGLCHVGDLDALMTQSSTNTVQNWMDFLEGAGWEFTK